MKTQHISSASAAAVLMVSMAAFAQTPQSSSPSTQTPTPSTEAASPSSEASQQSTQANKQPETPVTLVGCVMREADYRKANDSGKGGPVGTGLGRGNEYVLVHAMKTTAGSPSAASSIDCASATGSAGSGEAYELGGSRAKDVANYVGQRVEITGTLKEAKTTSASGEAKPTGGFDPLKQDLKLFEVDVASVRPLPSSQSAAAPAAAAPARQAAPAAPASRESAQAPAPAQPAAPATPPSQQQSASAPRQSLPRTASPLPVTALFGLLSMATGLVLRRRG
jgi:hypothetical protein